MRDTVSRLVITTPEGISFSLQLAGPILRFLAWVIDFAVLLLAQILVIYFTGILQLIVSDSAFALMILSFFLLQIGYPIVLEWFWNGQTLGKWLLRIRVMDETGLRLHFSQIVIRNLLRFVDFMPSLYLVGGVACFINRRNQRLGDFAANTVVVYRPRAEEPDLEQALPGKYNSFRQHPHLAARLRQSVDPEEASLVLQALLRRDELEPEARVELFQELAAHLREYVTFPEEAVLGLTDEQYVRNAVDIIYQPHGEPAPAKV